MITALCFPAMSTIYTETFTTTRTFSLLPDNEDYCSCGFVQPAEHPFQQGFMADTSKPMAIIPLQKDKTSNQCSMHFRKWM